jgi:hypothetical protein
MTTVYCFANGVIKFSHQQKFKIPNGALLICKGPKRKQIHDAIEVLARESYPTKRGGKDTCLLVPGIPEAKDQMEALDALIYFAERVKHKLEPDKYPLPAVPEKLIKAQHEGLERSIAESVQQSEGTRTLG